MPLNSLHIGPFASVYVGLCSPATDVLTQLTGVTTGAHRVVVNIPEAFNYDAQNSLQSGPAQLTASLTFLSDDPQAWRLAYGNFLNAAFQDTASQFVRLTLLLVHPDETAESSFLFPLCYAQKSITTDWSKTGPTTIPLTFTWQDTNRFDTLYYKRTAAQLASILGARTPI